jgi:predicted amidophosphoribosyltransferase
VGDVAVPGLDQVWALVAYEGSGADLVRGLKFANRRGAVGLIGRALAGLVPEDEPVDVVTWVPATPARRRARGYDQAELLARHAARALRRPARALVRRAEGRSQTGLGRAQRLDGPAVGPRGRCPEAVVVVDDVVTTGASLAAVGRTLRHAGARRLSGLVVAVTPLEG